MIEPIAYFCFFALLYAASLLEFSHAPPRLWAPAADNVFEARHAGTAGIYGVTLGLGVFSPSMKA